MVKYGDSYKFKKMKKIAILVPDGVGIRNYLYSDFFKKLIQTGNELILLHDLSEEALLEIENSQQHKINAFRLLEYRESFIEKFYRELQSSVMFTELYFQLY